MSGKPLAACYLRSSKDRADVSIAAQRRQLHELAQSKALDVCDEFADAVERANDEGRPGFQRLLAAIRSSSRRWRHLLVLDTSRIARDVWLAALFTKECERRDVTIHYANLPQSNSAVDVVVLQVYRAFDQLHSMTSREKALAGMRENIARGFRAGGRAPLGYRLDHVGMGVQRGGEEVRKAKLAPSVDAPAVAAYLKARAAGRSRPIAAQLAGGVVAKKAATSLLALERNAEVYAGHTVWNVAAPRDVGGGYKGGQKTRPNQEWVKRERTHEALITDAEAAAILARGRRARPVREHTTALLSGLLRDPSGTAWHGHDSGQFYRLGKGRRVAAGAVDEAVLGRIRADLTSEAFGNRVLDEARRLGSGAESAELAAANEALAALRKRLTRLSIAAAETAGEHSAATRALYRHMDVVAREAEALEAEVRVLREHADASRALAALTIDDVRKMMLDFGAGLEKMAPDRLRIFLRGLIDRVELDAETGHCRVVYRLPAQAGKLLASPRGFEPLFAP